MFATSPKFLPGWNIGIFFSFFYFLYIKFRLQCETFWPNVFNGERESERWLELSEERTSSIQCELLRRLHAITRLLAVRKERSSRSIIIIKALEIDLIKWTLKESSASSPIFTAPFSLSLISRALPRYGEKKKAFQFTHFELIITLLASSHVQRRSSIHTIDFN